MTIVVLDDKLVIAAATRAGSPSYSNIQVAAFAVTAIKV